LASPRQRLERITKDHASVAVTAPPLLSAPNQLTRVNWRIPFAEHDFKPGGVSVRALSKGKTDILAMVD
jgi:hypothetical protein